MSDGIRSSRGMAAPSSRTEPALAPPRLGATTRDLEKDSRLQKDRFWRAGWHSRPRRCGRDDRRAAPSEGDDPARPARGRRGEPPGTKRGARPCPHGPTRFAHIRRRTVRVRCARSPMSCGSRVFWVIRGWCGGRPVYPRKTRAQLVEASGRPTCRDAHRPLRAADPAGPEWFDASGRAERARRPGRAGRAVRPRWRPGRAAPRERPRRSRQVWRRWRTWPPWRRR